MTFICETVEDWRCVDIEYLDTKPFPNKESLHTDHIYRKLIYTHFYLGWNSNHPISARKSVFHTLIYKAKNVLSTARIVAMEMVSLYHVLLKHNYPEWMMKEPEKTPSVPIINPESGLEIKKGIHFFSLCPCSKWRVQKDLPLH